MQMQSQSQRLMSLDVFRGLTIAGMILVNNPGNWDHVYRPLLHAEWHGWTPTDLIFPFFLFIVGISIKLSLDKYLKLGKSRSVILPRIFRRTALLFVLGLILQGFPHYDLSVIRIPGVLPRISVCYLLVSLLYLAHVKTAGGRLYFSPQFMLWTGLGFLAFYYVLMQFVPVPGYGSGRWDSPEGNLAAYIDRAVFGAHLWRLSRIWDPEGLLSTLPALTTTITGVICAWWLKLQHQNRLQKLSMLFIAGAAGILIAYACSLLVPINKNLWTPSFVFLSSGFASLVLGACVWLVDMKSWKRWAQSFVVLGSNAITVYFLSSIAGVILAMVHISGDMSIKLWLYQSVFDPVFGATLGSLMYALIYVLFWVGVMAVLYVHRVFIRV
ncbi:DUF5009 domain-containing protein [bacterium]|nr:DUF5009 domain-containing protein [bacterium]